jgi:hypothetical protein
MNELAVNLAFEKIDDGYRQHRSPNLAQRATAHVPD